MDQNHLHTSAVLKEEMDKKPHLEKRILRDQQNLFEMPDFLFTEIFRLNKHTVMYVISELDILVSKNEIPLHVKVLAFLHFLGSKQSPAEAVSGNQTEINTSINEVSELINMLMFESWVKFPKSRKVKRNIKQGFYSKCNIRDVVGVIGNTHVEIIPPPITDKKNPPFIFENSKKKHSLNVMLICDSDYKIIECHARSPGGYGGSDIWDMSDIRSFMQQQYNNGDKSTYLIGDAKYLLEPWLLVPYTELATNSKENSFNYLLKTVQTVMEKTNGILKGRFRALSRFSTLRYLPDKAAEIIHSACILHNVALAFGEELPEEEIEYREDYYSPIHSNVYYEDDPNVHFDEDILRVAQNTRRKYTEANVTRDM